MYKALPLAISDFLASVDKSKEKKGDSAISEINNSIEKSDRTIFDQITFDNFGYYLGFDKL